jgi:transaldolase
MSTIVADTGDLGAVERLKPVDCTTNPTIVLKAIQDDAYSDVVDEALSWGRKQSGDPMRVAASTADCPAISVGVELLRRVPGYVSTEVDATLSFNVTASAAKARQIIADYEHSTGPRPHQARSYVGGNSGGRNPAAAGREVQHDAPV